MKRLGFLLLTLLPGLGCSGLGPMAIEGKGTTAARSAPPPPAAVTGDTINEKNALDRARALREELEYETSRPINAE